MTEQEIEKLREKLGSEYSVKRLNGVITVELADIWEGVEFAECVEYHKGSRTGAEIIKGQIYRIIDWFKRELVYFDGFEYGWHVRFFKPSTESAYVEQLKAKAHELYGEIKDGDRFDISMLEEDPKDFRMFYDNPIFTYYKKDDSLWAGNYPIYKQGKWAKKIERVRVEFTWSEGVKEDYRFHFKTSSNDNLHHAGHHLAKCLEDYLNNS